MTALDIILLLIFIGSAWLGFRKGIIKQLGSLAAIVIAIIACRCLGQPVTEMLTGAHPDWQASPISRATVSILANALIYLVAYYGVIIVAKLLRMVSHAILLGPLDRIAGAAFSVAKYFLLVSLLLNLYMVIFPSDTLSSRSHLCNGRVVVLTARFAPWVLGAIPALASDGGDCPKTVSTEKAPVSTETAI
ncbi:MAG: CvpA family protein [Duncaniella sp.]|uniref:CvpA family protein n=1 Tax=Duncaniella sp. TaxID=2518496 RepID=UPI0023CBB6D8|nr:CvpA family protein [Duncaniella sp.]MDE5989809.1 CvpA family protein [Duncaniella sp.]